MIAYEWRENRAYLMLNQKHNLTINLDGREQNIPYVFSYKTKSLVGVDTNLSNNNKDIIITFYHKLA